MTAKFTLMARVGGKFITVEIKHGTPIAPAGATSYYVRFTDETGKRQTKPLGKDLPAAFTEFRNLEIAREEKSRIAVQQSPSAPDGDNLSLGRLRKRVARMAEIQSEHNLMLGTLRGELASLSVLVNGLLDPKRRESKIEKHLNLSSAARRAGVGPEALKNWLAKDLGICFPKVPRGSRILVRERDVEYVLAKRRDARLVRTRPSAARLF